MYRKPTPSTIIEGATSLSVYIKQDTTERGPGKKVGLPFYNPAMAMNRDISILVLQYLLSQSKKTCQVLDGMAASGIRGFRFASEVNGNVHITINDWEDTAFHLIKQNAEQFGDAAITPSQENIHVLLSQNTYDYIDIDPFGSPATYIDSALRSIRHNGIIAASATDTATLCGVYPKVCKRRYNALPLHGACMHETALRILIGFIGRQAGKYDKGIIPLLCYQTDHYLRCYLIIKKGVTSANQTINQITQISSTMVPGQIDEESLIGPLWMGDLHDKHACVPMQMLLLEKHLEQPKQVSTLLALCEQEATMPAFYYSTNTLSQQHKKSPPPLERIIKEIQDKGYYITKTQFDPTGFKTNAERILVEQVFQQLTI